MPKSKFHDHPNPPLRSQHDAKHFKSTHKKNKKTTQNGRCDKSYNKTEVCQFFFNNKCRFGEKCRNAHPIDESPQGDFQIRCPGFCVEYVAGNCAKGAKCKDMHFKCMNHVFVPNSENSNKKRRGGVVYCKHRMTGTLCHFGDKCGHNHDFSMVPRTEALEDEPQTEQEEESYHVVNEGDNPGIYSDKEVAKKAANGNPVTQCEDWDTACKKLNADVKHLFNIKKRVENPAKTLRSLSIADAVKRHLLNILKFREAKPTEAATELKLKCEGNKDEAGRPRFLFEGMLNGLEPSQLFMMMVCLGLVDFVQSKLKEIKNENSFELDFLLPMVTSEGPRDWDQLEIKANPELSKEDIGTYLLVLPAKKVSDEKTKIVTSIGEVADLLQRVITGLYKALDLDYTSHHALKLKDPTLNKLREVLSDTLQETAKGYLLMEGRPISPDHTDITEMVKGYMACPYFTPILGPPLREHLSVSSRLESFLRGSVKNSEQRGFSGVGLYLMAPGVDNEAPSSDAAIKVNHARFRAIQLQPLGTLKERMVSAFELCFSCEYGSRCVLRKEWHPELKEALAIDNN